MAFLIKICGITSPDDAAMVARAGAGAIGVNFWAGSKRFVDDDSATRILAAVPAGILKFGVFVNATAAEVLDRVARFGLDRVQLHGDERPADFGALASSLLVRAIRIRDRGSLAETSLWNADLFLYDAFVEGYGGGGIAPSWTDIAAAASAHPFLLAGGLVPGNVAAAIVATRPAGVDVASGVESAPGKKDPARVAAFIAAARAGAARAAARNLTDLAD